MMHFSRYQATDPRDKVFAILGLVTDDLDIEEWIDYDKTPGQVYTKIAKYILSRKEDGLALLALAGVGHARKLNGLPTWVPDWSKPPSGIPLDSFSVRYNASEGRKCDEEILLDHDLDIIRLIGAKVDTVKVVVKAHIDKKSSMDDKTCFSQRQSRCHAKKHFGELLLETEQPKTGQRLHHLLRTFAVHRGFFLIFLSVRTSTPLPSWTVAPAAFPSEFRTVLELFLNPSLLEKANSDPSMGSDFLDGMLEFFQCFIADIYWS
ncbi:uncharacterized protein PAC_03420 [Phialocephala subalpina]|uniref:Heterokaryon incompatibility domain-containing protein n=1 Tax=Phialocephala subalpina TaxID=576137 RepID=A0A1L7WL90_9HELO|nr:uncharacterized protein PAC_03420 [Phialocephala subalpina]